MLPYFMLLIVVFTLAYYVQTQQRVSNQNLIRKAHTQDGRWVLVIMTGILVLFAGLREMSVGSDTGMYEWIFRANAEMPFWGIMTDSEGLFWGGAQIIYFVTSSTTMIFLIIAMVTIIPIVKTFSEYSINFSLSIFLYITMMDYFVTFNGIRQGLAATIVFSGITLLLKKKKWEYCLLIVFAALIHNSAIIILPFTFILFWPPKSGKTYILYLLIFMVFFVFPSQTNAVLEWLAPEEYKKYFANEGDDGVNVLRVIVAFLPVLLTRIYYQRITENQNEKPLINLLINFSTLNFLFMVVGMRNTTMARLGMYFSMYNVLLIPYLLRVFKEESRLTAKVIVMVCFFAYFYLLLPVDSELLPYRNILDSLW